jgi:hypothetical protein
MKRLIFYVSMWFVGCGATCATGIQPGPGPQPIPTAATACDNLALRGCPSGIAQSCVVVLQQMVDEHITRIDLGCLTGAQTQDAVRACGGVTCQ